MLIITSPQLANSDSSCNSVSLYSGQMLGSFVHVHFTSFKGCHQGDIRLVDESTKYEGHVEICINNTWSMICGDGWGNIDARIVCRQLGFSIAGTLDHISLFT